MQTSPSFEARFQASLHDFGEEGLCCIHRKGSLTTVKIREASLQKWLEARGLGVPQIHVGGVSI